MRLAIRWKLLGSYLFLLLVMGGALFSFLNRTLAQQPVEDIRANLQREARLAAQMASREMVDLGRDAPQLAQAIGKTLQARVTIIAEDGRVVGDSELSATALAGLDNHRSRPEIAAALTQGHGSSVRYSTTVGGRMLYVAVRLPAAARTPAVLRIAVPLAAVEAARVSLHESLAVTFGLAALLAVGLSLFLTQLSSRILHDLGEGAERFGAGDFRRKVPVASNDELGELAQVMNAMAGRLQQQMEHLALDRNRLDTILRGMGEGLLVADRDGTVRLLNPAFRTLFRVGEEAVGHPLVELSRHPQLQTSFRAVLSEQRERIAELTLGGEADARVLLTHWVPLREGGEVTGVVAVFHDISDLKRLERVRRDFVANVSHELRTPVTVIRGYAETLAGDLTRSDPETAARFAAVIHHHAERLTALIADLLTLSELEGGTIELPLEPIPLAALNDSCCALIEPKAVAKDIVLDCHVDPALLVLAHRGRLEQVLINLLDNAVKYSPPGGKVALGAALADGKVRISVADNGPGIPAAALPRLFERFYRVDAGRGRDEGGTGLGLAIVKHIVQLHGGKVWVESTPGQGSIFHVELRQG
ncbi:MAG TPA: PAS domain-containing sensor histidine kinase [Desulfuromonas sp.]|nr:PAS domain-containing sensor histidine kinase [Desulfuromonas sp.]